MNVIFVTVVTQYINYDTGSYQNLLNYSFLVSNIFHKGIPLFYHYFLNIQWIFYILTLNVNVFFTNIKRMGRNNNQILSQACGVVFHANGYTVLIRIIIIIIEKHASGI